MSLLHKSPTKIGLRGFSESKRDLRIYRAFDALPPHTVVDTISTLTVTHKEKGWGVIIVACIVTKTIVGHGTHIQIWRFLNPLPLKFEWFGCKKMLSVSINQKLETRVITESTQALNYARKLTGRLRRTLRLANCAVSTIVSKRNFWRASVVPNCSGTFP